MNEGAKDRPGSYLLFVHMDRPRLLSIGRLGQRLFLPGTYLYCGSGLNGVKARVGRHFRKCKRTHWHIDHLLQGGEPYLALLLYSDQRCECSVAERLERTEGVVRSVKGFGSSDCRCPGHLFYCPDMGPELMERIKEAFR